MSDNTFKPIFGLHPTFIGSSTILNNGTTPNTIQIGLTNNNLFGAAKSSEVDIVFTPTEKLFLWFVVDDEDASNDDPARVWALTSYDHFHSFDVKVHIILPDGTDDSTNWTIVRNKNVRGGPLNASLDGWQMNLRSNYYVLKPGENIRVQISGIISGLPDGPTTAYFDVTGWPRGTTFGPIQKTPHVLRGEKVGIGTNTPGVSLDVRGGIRARGGGPGAFGDSNHGYFFNPPGDNDSGMSSSADGQIEFYVDNTEAIRIMSPGYHGKHIRLGIGMDEPTAQLHVSSKNVGEDKVSFRVGGNGQLAIDANDGTKGGRLTILQNGNMGIGTNNPLVPLQIGDKVGASSNRTTEKSDKQPLLWITQNEVSDSDENLGTPCLDLRNSNQTNGTGSMLTFSGLSTGAWNGEGIAGAAIKGIFNFDEFDLYGALAFYTRGERLQFNERLRITSEGNVGIGTTTPGATLEVDGDVKVTGNMYGTFIHFIDPKQIASGKAGAKYGATIDLTKQGVPKGANAVILSAHGGTNGKRGGPATISVFPPDNHEGPDHSYKLLYADQSNHKGDVGRAFNEGTYPVWEGSIYLDVNDYWDFGWEVYLLGWYGPPS